MLLLLWYFVLPLLGLWLLIRFAPLASLPPISWRDLWTVEGAVDRGPFLCIGFILMALKYNIERIVSVVFFKRPWTVLAYYLNAPIADGAVRADASFYGAMILLSLPFIWTGMALTTRRLRSAGLPEGLSMLFFFPFVNLLFFLVLACLPARVGMKECGPSGMDGVIPRSTWGSAVFTVGLCCVGALLSARFAVQFLRQYGYGVFVGLPFCIGLISALVYGHHKARTMTECLAVAGLSLFCAGVVLLAAAFEGIICLMMAFPLALPLAAMGAMIGYLIQSRPGREGHGMASAALALGLPALMGAEYGMRPTPPLHAVATSIVINAPPERVWENVVSFSELPPPRERIFSLGYAYPLRAEISGKGPGAVRRCVFTTGAFVEPIEVWDEPRRLVFSVTSQPPPMTETSPFGKIAAPHLDDFLRSEKGQFLLTPLPGGGTRLEGTTWYRHRIWPSAYWRLWSDWIISAIHGRVLEHIKNLSEKFSAGSGARR